MSEKPLRIGVVGYGYWGPNLVRNFSASPLTHVAAVADGDAERRQAVSQLYPWVRVAEAADEMLADPAIDAVAVATPLGTHHELCKRALEAGKHVLCEKPLADSLARCEELVRLAQQRRRILMVDHTFVFTGAVRKIKEYVEAGALGDVLYFDSVRINLGLFQSDSNVIWDLATHDLAILDFVIGKSPRWVTAVAVKHFGNLENLAYLTIGFDGDLIAHLHCNWISPLKVRRILIGGTRRMLVYDDTEPSEKLKLYDHGITISSPAQAKGKHEMLVQYRTGDVLAPKLDGTEALARVVETFARACALGEPPVTDGAAGARVVRVLEAAQRSLEQHGARVTP